MAKHLWKKGQSGNPKGRQPIMLPELRQEIDANKNAVKKLILMYLNMSVAQISERQRTPNIPVVETIIAQVIEKSLNDGDMVKFKMLLEIPLGKLPEEAADFETTPEERAIIVEYRRRIEKTDEPRTIEDSAKDS